MSKHTHSFLALGDSYTIGEGLPLFESFPYQVVRLLRLKGFHFHAAEIVAKTGWTTFELAENILHSKLEPPYDFVTLCIGVNNQYRNLPANEYKNDFEFLLKKAIHLCSENASHVVVLSIPDWSTTPFAKNRNPEKIGHEIERFNSINNLLADQYKAAYLDITPGTKTAGNDTTFLIDDKLHYSAKEYERWAKLVADVISKYC